MRKIVILLLGIIFSSLSLFGDDVELGLEFANKGDYAKAKKLWEKACDSGDLNGCYNLGILYEKGQGVKQDYFKAKELYEKTCNEGYKIGCFNLALSYYKGQGVRQDTKKAKEYFGKACDLGDQQGCNAYAKLNK